jgi:hypothetical protein
MIQNVPERQRSSDSTEIEKARADFLLPAKPVNCGYKPAILSRSSKTAVVLSGCSSGTKRPHSSIISATARSRELAITITTYIGIDRTDFGGRQSGARLGANSRHHC